MDAPRQRIDPLALAVLGVAGCLIVVIAAYVALKWSSAPAPKPAPVIAGSPAKKAPQKPVAQKPEPKKPQPQQQAAPVPAELLAEHGAGRVWHYSVIAEPAVWREATLSYRIVEKGGDRAVDAEFRHAAGEMKFRLGALAAGHPSHANVRFPGFFLYAAYLDRPLEAGSRFVWQWPWQMSDGRVVAGRVKRYEGEVKAWETLPAPPAVRAPMNTFSVARIDATLTYIDGGTVRATAKETLWYAPRYLQVVKVVRDGRTPDEGAQRIVAELVAVEYP